MSGTPAMFVPWGRTTPDQADFFVTAFLRDRSSPGNGLFIEKPVVAGLHGINAATLTIKVRIGIFIPHDASGNGYNLAVGLTIQALAAL